MTVTVHFADRVTPPTMANTGPKVESLDDDVIEAGVSVDVDGGWLLVLGAPIDAEGGRDVLAAYCPGSVIKATVDSGPVDPTSSDVATPSTSAPAGDGSASIPSTASSGEQPVATTEPAAASS